jgi:hypothetical protein
MNRAQLIPKYLLGYPHTSKLSQAAMLLYYHLWATTFEYCGCDIFNFSGFEGTLKMKISDQKLAILELQEAKLLYFDASTCEYQLPLWFELQRPFKLDIKLIEESYARIESSELKASVQKHYNEYLEMIKETDYPTQ